jgi:hypothetical protein
MAATARRHETRALLRAHLSAASRYPHLTRHCPICHRLQRLALEHCTDSDWDIEGDKADRADTADETPRANSSPL